MGPVSGPTTWLLPEVIDFEPNQEPEAVQEVGLLVVVQERVGLELLAKPVTGPSELLAFKSTVGAGAVMVIEHVFVMRVEVPELIVTEAFLVPVPTAV